MSRRQEKILKVIAGAPNKPLRLGNAEIQCYVLEGEHRVLSQGGFLKAIGRSRTRQGKSTSGVATTPPVFLSAKNLSPYVSKDLIAATTPIKFEGPGSSIALGYRAEVLPKVCEVYLRARDAGTLLPSQQHIARQADIIIRALATVGIVALVDEATGYQVVRGQRALAVILEKFIAKELQPWAKTFPDEFYEEICRLHGWSPERAVKRPSLVGKITNDLIYTRLAPHLLPKLEELNPINPKTGWREAKHHQWLTEETGRTLLKEHIGKVLILMKVSQEWSNFLLLLEDAFPKQPNQMRIPL